MKKLLFAVSALAALSLLAPSTGFAQHPTETASNQVGMFMDNAGMGDNFTMTVGVVDAFVVLIKPTDVENSEAPYPSVNFYDFRLNFNPTGGLFKLATTQPPTSIDIGDQDHIGDGYLEFINGIGTDWPLTGGNSVWLAGIQFLVQVATPIEVTMGVVSAPSIAGEMSYMSEVGQLRVMYPASGSFANPVFTFNVDGPVAVDNESFGSVKALYR